MSGRLKLRRGVVVAEEPLTVEVDGERRPAWADTALLGEMREGDEVVVNVAALDLGLGSGGFDVVHVNLTRGLEGGGAAGGEHVIKLNYTSLQHPVEPVERALRSRSSDEAQRTRTGAVPVLVLPLHGHLAPAAWAAAQAAPGLQGRLRADRRRGAAGLALAATSPSCASAACSAATSPPRPAYGGEHEALSVVGALDAAADRLGWDAVLVGPGPGIIGSETELGHGGMAALDSAHAALSLGLPTLLSPRLSAADPRERHRGVSHHTLHRAASCCSAPVEVPVPAGEPVADRRSSPRRPRLAATACARRRSTSTAYAASRPAGADDGPRLDEDPLFFAAAARRGRALLAPASARSACAKGCAAGRTSRHGDRSQARRPAAPAEPGADARFEGLVLDFLSYLELERGLSRNTLNAYRTDLLQYGEFLAAHELDALTARPADIADFLAELATGNGRPPCSASTIHRKAACLRSFYKHLRRDELIGDDPTAALSAPRRAKKLPQVLNYAEVQKLLASPRGERADDAARPGAARGDVRLRAARLGDDRARARRHRPARGLPARPRQGLQGAAGAARPPGDRRDQRLPARRPAEAGRRAPRAEAVRQLPRRPADPPGPLQDRPAPRPRRRPRRPDEPAHAAPQLRHPPARRRLRPARRAGDARPRRHRDDPDVHAPLRRAPQGGLLRRPPAQRRRAADR